MTILPFPLPMASMLPQSYPDGHEISSTFDFHSSPTPNLSLYSYSSQCMASLPIRTTPKPRNLPNSPSSSSPAPPPRYKAYFHSIASLCRQGQTPQSLAILREMSLIGLSPGPDIFGELLQGCAYERNPSLGRQIHAIVAKKGALFAENDFVGAKLVAFYSKCGTLDVAEACFARTRVRSVFSWAAVIGLRAREGMYREALVGVCEMVETGVLPDEFVVPNLLKACAGLRWARFGRAVHGYAVKMGQNGCVFVCSSLVDMYGKCGVLDDARKVFVEIPDRNVVSWNSIIVGCVQNGLYEDAIRVFFDMRLEGVEPTRVTLCSFLSACAFLGAVEEGRQGHALAVLGGLELDSVLGTSILNFYLKVGLVENAELVFNCLVERDVVTWNKLISGYVKCEKFDDALNVCRLMRLEDKRYDTVTLTSILSACAGRRDLRHGKAGHCYCFRNNLESDVVVASGIVEMYAKCGRISDARRVFDSTIKKDLILWNSILTAYAELGLSGETMRLFYQMQLDSVPANSVSWRAVILGCLKSGQIQEAEELLSQMQSQGIHLDMIWPPLHPD